MQLYYADRGAKVLYDFLVSNQISGTFLLPANICESVPNAFHEAGCKVEYVDIDPNSLCINEQEVLNRILEFNGVLVVHTYGTERDFNAFYRRVRQMKLDAIIIDDRCLCWPDFEIEGRYDDVEADITLFSLGDKKQVQLGEGGVGIYVDGKWKMESGRWMLEMERYLEKKEVAKSHIAKMQTIYAENLPKEIQLPMEYNNWRFNIRVSAEKKDKIIEALFANNLFASSHYKSLTGDAEQTTPNAVRLQQEIINLFVDPKYYTEEQAIQTCRIINDILNTK